MTEQERDDLAELRERLKAEKAEAQVKDYEAGYATGMIDARENMSYREFDRFDTRRLLLEQGTNMGPPWDTAWGALPDWVKEKMDMTDGNWVLELQPEFWAQGWIDAVLETWDKVKDSL